MGVLYDYFAARDDATAAAAIDLHGGPGGPIELPMPYAELVKRYGYKGASEYLTKLHLSEHGFHTVSTKNFDPFTDLPPIEESLTGRSPENTWDTVAMRDEGERFVIRLGDSTRTALATATEPVLTAAAEEWVRIAVEEEAIDPDPDPITHLVKELAALAQGAVERGENLYCWVCV